MATVKDIHNLEVTDDLIFKFFRGDTTEDEENRIRLWIAEDKANEKRYNFLHDLYDAHLISAPMDMIEHYPAEAGVRSHRRKNIFRRTVVAVSGIAAAIALVFVTATVSRDMVRSEMAETMNTIEVPAGKSMDYILADGTLIKLNSGARLQYPMAFAKDRREVQLEGEAYFDVAHNDRQPFVVNTFACKIEVLGTTFSVNADEESRKFSAVLAEGSVKLSDISDPDKTIVMEPDQKVSFSNGRFILYDRPAELEMRWTEGIIDIGGLPFDELMKKLEKSFGVEIVIDRDTLPAIGFTDGRIRISDGIEDALRILQQGADFTWSKDYRTGVITIR